VSSVHSSTAASSTEDHLGRTCCVGQARAVPHSHSNRLRCTTCFHPPRERFLTPSDKPSLPLRENRVCLQLECPNPKYVPQPACARPGRFCTVYPEQPDGTVFMQSDRSLMAGQSGWWVSWALAQKECSMRNRLGVLCEGLRGNENEFCGSYDPRRCLGKHADWDHSLHPICY